MLPQTVLEEEKKRRHFNTSSMFAKIKTPFSAEEKDVYSHGCHILLHREYASAASHSALKCTVSKYAIGSFGYRIVTGKGLPPYFGCFCGLASSPCNRSLCKL